MRSNEQKLLNMMSNYDVTFYIPPYQRNYEWTKDQCSVFYEDIIKTYKRNAEGHLSEHFFGTITYFQAEKTFGQPSQLVLIDGQQRITTTMLFLVAIRDIISDEATKNVINNKFLKNNDASGDNDEYKVKLKQVESDWPAYKNIILGQELTETEKDSAVYRDYQYFMHQLKKYVEEGNDPAELIENGLGKFSVVTIELEPMRNEWENPQEIFESMNSLGKPLSLADLVRNYLLLGLNPEVQNQLYKEYWLNIEKTIPGQISNYIRDYMQLHEKASFKKASETNYKELYSQFKEIFEDTDARTILSELSRYAILYKYLLPEGRTGHPLVDYELADLQVLKVTTAYSFLLDLLIRWDSGEYSDEDLHDILDAFRIYIIRRRLIGLTAAENKNFPGLARFTHVLVGSIDKTRAMFEILANQDNNLRLPNDREIEQYLTTANFANSGYCKFVLALMEEKITKSRPDTSNGALLQLEHIMPQTLTGEWRVVLGPNAETIHAELVNTIGNLTLTRHNQELGNKSFEYKKKYYENRAGMQIAKEDIIDQDVWDEIAIKNRTANMISFLLKDVLPIPDDMRKSNNYTQKQSRRLSFINMGLLGEEIDFIKDPSIIAKVVSDKEVEFEGERWRLSPLTAEIQKRRGQLTKSGTYSGADYWEYEGVKLYDLY